MTALMDIAVYPFIELLMLMLFCRGMHRHKFSFRTWIVSAACLAVYMIARYYLIADYDAAILVLRILFFTVLGYLFYEVSWENIAFLSACLSLFLHTVIVFYYNIPFLSGVVRQWPLGDLLLINLLRAALVLWLSRTAAEVSRAKIGMTEYLLAGVSYLGYFFDIRSYIAVTSGRVSTLENSVVLFMYCLATSLAVIAAMWHIVSRSRRDAANQLEESIRRQYEVWNQKTERDAAIARMYHDIRKQISLIGNLESGAAQTLTQALQDSVAQYSEVPDTGDAILNTLLGEKAQLCKEKGIALQCITQFESLEPLSGLDLCSIVGNAMDNAIEACERMPENAEKEIILRILQTEAFLAFRVENSFSGELKTEHGQIVTLKADTENHGIGLSSIRYSAGKYGGELRIEASENRFVLKIIIPQSEEGIRAE